MLFNQGTKLSTAQKVAVIAIVVLLLIGFALMMYGEWGPSIGQEAMGTRVAQTTGVALFGASMLLFFGLFSWLDVKEIKHTAPSLRRAQWRQLLREIGTVALNLLIYGGTVILFLGCIASLDDVSSAGNVVVLLLMAVSVAGFAAYRRHRHRHKATYQFVGSLGLPLFLLIMGAVALMGAVDQGICVADDLASGPVTVNVVAVDAEQNHPTGRYQALRQDTVTVCFESEDGRRFSVTISQEDWPEALRQQGNMGYCRATLYPATGIFVEAQPWPEGRQAMADLPSAIMVE